jgi:HK97 family phage prohead protease
MTTQHKALAPFEIKATDAETRTFEGLASTWSLDLGGDVIHPGAFRSTLKEWKRTGRVIPLIDQHRYQSVRHVLGKLLEAEETDAGLLTKWRVVEGQDGDELLHRLRGGMIDGLSLGYNAKKWDTEEKDGAVIRHIKEIELQEVSAVIWGMNPGALIDTASVKTMLDAVDPAALDDDDRKGLRALASKIGALLRPTPDPAKAAAPDADEADAPPPPEATPADAAVSQADTTEEPEYLYADALKQRLLRVRLQRATL